MKKLFKVIVVVVSVLIISSGVVANANEAEDFDKTLSPYFLVKSDTPQVESLPLKSTSADVKIAGVIADVKVTQVYKNEGSSPIEAIYVFPASTKAAVYAMKMTIEDRVIEAEIREKQEARQEYEEAKEQGKSASLLEQTRPNVFKMNVANIMPGDEIKVELSYTELLVPSEGTYRFLYPTVVGPRYVSPSSSDSENDSFEETPYQRTEVEPSYDFNINVEVSAGIPIQEVNCTSHGVNIEYEKPSIAKVGLLPEESKAGNKDFILDYKLSGEKIDSGLLLYEGDEENFFLLMSQPPKRVVQEQIPPREYIFIVDVSGSMYGFPLNCSKTLMKNLLSNLREEDKFNVMLFASSSSVLSPESLPATQENIKKAINLIDNQGGYGGTELLPALKRAIELPGVEGVSRTTIIATDGYVNVEKEAFDIIKNNLNKSNFFAFGIGMGVNQYLIEGIARMGMGEPFLITKPAEADEQAEKFRKYISSPVLTEIDVNFDAFETYEVIPETIPDLFAERPIILFGKWKGSATGSITISGKSGNEEYNKTIDISQYQPSESNSALRYLWARHMIAMLDDYNSCDYSSENEERKNQVVQLGLKYNLLTNYTSFIAVDHVIRNDAQGNPVEVKQPLPLTEGMTNMMFGLDDSLTQKVIRNTTSSVMLRYDYALTAIVFVLLLFAIIVAMIIHIRRRRENL